MIEWSQRVFIDETDSLMGCPMDQYEIVTYLGKHITSCEARMCDEVHGTAVVLKDTDYDLGDLNILHQETLSKLLDDYTSTYMLLEYEEDTDLQWLEYDVIDSFELDVKATKRRAAYRLRAFSPEGTNVTQYVAEVYACGKKYKATMTWQERNETLRYLLNVALRDSGWSSCECSNVIDKGFVASIAA